MGFRLKKPKKTILVSLMSLVLALFLILNLMMVQLNSSADSGRDPVVYPKVNKVILNTFDDEEFYKVQIHRKPKTANFDDLEDESQPQKDKFPENNNFQAGLGESFEINKEIKKHGKTKKLTDNDNKVFHEGDFNNEPNYSDENLKNSKEIEEMENIDDDYEDDEEYEEEENDEYDYDDTNDDKPNFKLNNEQFKYKTNPVFKPGDFGDIRGLEYYRKPTLKVQDPQKHPPKPKLRATEEPSLVENGIYWSAYVDSLIPKGKKTQGDDSFKSECWLAVIHGSHHIKAFFENMKTVKFQIWSQAWLSQTFCNIWNLLIFSY